MQPKQTKVKRRLCSKDMYTFHPVWIGENPKENQTCTPNSLFVFRSLKMYNHSTLGNEESLGFAMYS